MYNTPRCNFLQTGNGADAKLFIANTYRYYERIDSVSKRSRGKRTELSREEAQKVLKRGHKTGHKTGPKRGQNQVPNQAKKGSKKGKKQVVTINLRQTVSFILNEKSREVPQNDRRHRL